MRAKPGDAEHYVSAITLITAGRESYSSSVDAKVAITGGAISPIMPPADDDFTAVNRVAVVTKISALILEFDPNTLPFSWTNLAFGLAIRVAGLYRFDSVPQFFSNHSEEEYDALFDYWLVP